MKKMILVSIALCALGFAANSLAAPAEIPTESTAATAKGNTKITIGGELRVRGVVQNNTGDFNGNSSNSNSNTNVTTTRERPRAKK